MVERQLQGRDIVDARVLAAMGDVPRHAFVPDAVVDFAYDDRPLPIGQGATISQPYIVAFSVQLACVAAADRVLDVGTGSGYQAAVLAAMGASVWGIEIDESLAQAASERLHALGYRVDVVAGDGWRGRAEHAPYDAIVVAAAAPVVPAALREQLADGGRLVVPVGPPGGSQMLTLVTRTSTGFQEQAVLPVAFVPLVDAASSS